MDTKDIGTMFQAGGWLSEKLSKYHPRPGQVELARAVNDAIHTEKHLLCEAPTGTGKSMAFGLPTAAWSMETGRTVVVVTSNITLQEQLMTKDFPLMASILAGKIKDEDGEEKVLRFGLMKGMGNYVCPEQIDWTIEDCNKEGVAIPTWISALKEQVGTDFSGDRSHLDVVYSDEDWKQVSATSYTCSRGECRYAKEGLCPWMRARSHISKNNIIITNYHYFYSDVVVRETTDGFVNLLPEYDLVVFDEAHDAPFIAMDFLGFNITLPQVLRLVNRGKLLPNMSVRDRDILEATKTAAEKFFALLPNKLIPRVGRGGYDREPSPIIQSPLNIEEGVSLQDSLQTIGKMFMKEARRLNDDTNTSTRSRWIGRAKRAIKLAETISRVNDGPFEDEDVFYLEKSVGRTAGRKGKSSVLYTICCKRAGVAEFFQESIFSKATVVAVSATLTAGNSFEYISSKFGLAETSEYTTLMVESPFDSSRMLPVIPRDIPEPSHPEFGITVAKTVGEIVTVLQGRLMVLFTSYANLTKTATYLKRHFPKLRLLVQNELPKMKIIEEMKAQPDNSVILATASFWQGVDLPGRDLLGVVIDKIPFTNPDDPILYYYDKKDGNGFLNYSVPRATIALKQGVGRLIRTETDYGVVVVLDSRIRTKGYGSSIMNAFPESAFIGDAVTDIAEFLEVFNAGE